MQSPWPDEFIRVPDEEWALAPLGELALKYDTVEGHGWYCNLDRTVDDLTAFLEPHHRLLDYSGGTGILASRLLMELATRGFGILIVDSSPKFLRLAVDKLGRQERMGFRLLRYLKEEKRLQSLQETVDSSLYPAGFDALVSTNAIHLYYGLAKTLRSWWHALRSGGRVFIQSGNIGLPYMPAGSWIIDETVEAIHRRAMEIVASEKRWSGYRAPLGNAGRMEPYDVQRRKFFLPVRPIEHYLSRLEEAGFRILEVTHLPIEAHVDQWYEFLSAYHDGVLGWVGGSKRIEGSSPTPEAVEDRLQILRDALDAVFASGSFRAIWTYINAERPEEE